MSFPTRLQLWAELSVILVGCRSCRRQHRSALLVMEGMGAGGSGWAGLQQSWVLLWAVGDAGQRSSVGCWWWWGEQSCGDAGGAAQLWVRKGPGKGRRKMQSVEWKRLSLGSGAGGAEQSKEKQSRAEQS